MDTGRSAFGDDDSSVAQDVIDPSSTEPSEADLLCFPPTLRFIYQLLRCLMGKPGCAGVSYTMQSQSSTHTEDEGNEEQQVIFEGHTPRDPVVLRHLLVCLNCLVRVGNALQNILNAATRAAEIAAAAAANAAIATVGNTPALTGRTSRTGGGSGTGGGIAGSAAPGSYASLNIQASFVLYMVEYCLIPTYVLMW